MIKKFSQLKIIRIGIFFLLVGVLLPWIHAQDAEISTEPAASETLVQTEIPYEKLTTEQKKQRLEKKYGVQIATVEGIKVDEKNNEIEIKGDSGAVALEAGTVAAKVVLKKGTALISTQFSGQVVIEPETKQDAVTLVGWMGMLKLNKGKLEFEKGIPKKGEDLHILADSAMKALGDRNGKPAKIVSIEGEVSALKYNKNTWGFDMVAENGLKINHRQYEGSLEVGLSHDSVLFTAYKMTISSDGKKVAEFVTADADTPGNLPNRPSSIRLMLREDNLLDVQLYSQTQFKEFGKDSKVTRVIDPQSGSIHYTDNIQNCITTAVCVAITSKREVAILGPGGLGGSAEVSLLDSRDGKYSISGVSSSASMSMKIHDGEGNVIIIAKGVRIEGDPNQFVGFLQYSIPGYYFSSSGHLTGKRYDQQWTMIDGKFQYCIDCQKDIEKRIDLGEIKQVGDLIHAKAQAAVEVMNMLESQRKLPKEIINYNRISDIVNGPKTAENLGAIYAGYQSFARSVNDNENLQQLQVSLPFLWAVACTEGACEKDFMIRDTMKITSAYMIFGTDTLYTEVRHGKLTIEDARDRGLFRDLIEGRDYYRDSPPDYGRTNEAKEKVDPMEFANSYVGYQGLANFVAYRQLQFKDQVDKLRGDFDSIPSRTIMAWTYVYYNYGEQGANRLVQQYGVNGNASCSAVACHNARKMLTTLDVALNYRLWDIGTELTLR